MTQLINRYGDFSYICILYYEGFYYLYSWDYMKVMIINSATFAVKIWAADHQFIKPYIIEESGTLVMFGYGPVMYQYDLTKNPCEPILKSTLTMKFYIDSLDTVNFFYLGNNILINYLTWDDTFIINLKENILLDN